MSRPRLLDLFSGAGGAGKGYELAGFEVVGVDITPQPRYPFEHHVADALTYPLDGFDAVHASPPCQDHSTLSTRSPEHGTGWMLRATLDRLAASGLPYVVENVVGSTLPSAVVLCGASFGLGTADRVLKRHRLFQCSWPMLVPPCQCKGRPVIGVYGNTGTGSQQRGYKGTVTEARAAMGIDWMTHAELAQAIPPAYTRWLGEHMIETCFPCTVSSPP